MERPTYPLRLAPSERRLLQAAATERQEYLSEYIRRTALEAARRQADRRNSSCEWVGEWV